MASGGGLPPPGFPTWDGGGFRAAAPPEFDRSQSTPTLESLQRQLAHSDGNEGGDYDPRRSPFDGSASNRSYATLGERLGDDDRAAYAWGAPERPQTAPLPEATAERRKTAEQANIQLLISSMQELTAVVARHSDELRRLREDNRAYARRDAALQDSFGAVDHALRDESARTAAALERVDARLRALEPPGARPPRPPGGSWDEPQARAYGDRREPALLQPSAMSRGGGYGGDGGDDRRRYDGAPAPLGHAQAFPSAPELYPSLNSLAIDGAYPPPPRAQSPAPSGLARNFST